MRLTGLAFIACCVLIGAPSAPTTFPAGRTRVDGNILRDARNRPILLSGANAEAFFFPPTGRNAQGIFSKMRSWNMNAARISSSITAWQKDPAGHVAQLARVAEAASIEQIVLVIALANDASQRH